MKRDIAFLFFLLLSLSWSIAQPYTVKRLGIEQGLSNNYVIGITQDKQGFLWFATEEGLNKFDGTRFITYYKNEPSQSNQGLAGNELNRIYADPDLPIIWIATQRDGLNAYNYHSQTFTAYQNDPKIPHSLITNDVTDIVPSKQKTNGLWVCTYYRGIDYLDTSTGKFTHYNKSTIPALANEQTWTALDSEDGNLYIGHVNAGLSILSLKDRSVRNFQHKPGDRTSLPGNEVRSILKDSNGNIWVGTDGGLALFNTATQEFITFKQNPNDKYGTLSSRIFSIKQLSDNKLWIASELNGIAILDLKQSLFLSPQQLTFEHLQEGDSNRSLSSASVRYVFQDSFNNIWIGTWGGGINFISNEPPLFTTYTYSPIPNTENCLNNKTVSSICTDNKGGLWIGTDGGGINVFENGKRTAIYKKENSEIQSNFVLSAFRDSKGNLWFGTFQGGISYFSSKTNSFHPVYPMNRSYLDVRTFYEDKQHRIWVGCSEGIYVLDPDNMEVIHHYHTRNSELRGNFVRSITQDEKGRFWIGTFGDGLGVYTPDFRLIKSFVQRDGFCSNTINYIYQDSRKRMWAATGEGLVNFPSTSSFNYKVYQRKDGLGNTFIQAITEDKKGNIWLSSNKGISCYVTDKDCFYNYGHSDDVPAGNFMSGSVARNEQSGMIYFGSINGICCFNPNTMMSELNIPPVVITEMKIFERLGNQENDETFVSLSEGNEVGLTHAQNTFSLTFNVQNYSLVNQVEYAYMLKGLENSWYTVKESNSVTFRNMPPGKYEFLIKARIHNQEWPDEATSLIIRINPPLWLTWWAKLAYFLITICVIYLILHAYKKKVDLESLYTLEKKNHEQEQELNQERLRFYTNITHELRTPLTLILGPLEDMQKDASLPAKLTQKLSVIHQSALRLLNLINQILEFRKTETQNKKLCVCKGNITPLIYETGLKYKELNQNQKLNFQIKIEKENLSLFFDKEIVTIILDNLISNAMKYTEQGQITLSVYRTVRNEVSYTEIKVSDTGYGISAEALPHIFDRYYQENCKHQASGTGIGLALVKNLIELHEGEIRVESTKHEGSTFYVSLLTDNIYPNALHADSLESETEEIEKEIPTEGLEALTDSGKPILLVVEDNEEIRNYIAESFSDSFEVITAANGKEGKQQALNGIPDIIVSDIMMPIMDGISLCRQLKEDVRTSHIPIILLTAKDSLQNKEEGYEVGADSYLTKPFSASLLRSRINNLLDSRKKLAAQFQSQTSPATSSGFNEKRAAITEALSRIDNEFIERITLLIEENLSSEKIDINYLSDKMCMSGSTLYRKMKALTGLSTNEYTRKVKMQNAERLLLEGKYNISEIAYKVGMNSTGYFRQCFKEEFGISPSDYLKQMKECSSD